MKFNPLIWIRDLFRNIFGRDDEDEADQPTKPIIDVLPGTADEPAPEQAPQEPSEPAPAPVEKTRIGMMWTADQLEFWPLWSSECSSVVIRDANGGSWPAMSITGPLPKQNGNVYAKFAVRLNTLVGPVKVELSNRKHGLITWENINPAISTTYYTEV